jgi:CheY-like chemotaxis protein
LASEAKGRGFDPRQPHHHALEPNNDTVSRLDGASRGLYCSTSLLHNRLKPECRNVLQMLLENDYARVMLAPNGHLAVNALKMTPNAFEMVLMDMDMDMDMPVMNGLQATRYIRQQLKLTELPIIAMTGHVMASAPQDCLDAGMNCHIDKPFKFEDLTALMLLHKQCVPRLVAPPRHRTDAAQ